MRVLIVDDDPDCRQIVALMLGRQGWTFTFAADGQEAVARARECQPDLVLMDVLMPLMTGFEAARAMRADERCAGATIFAITALAFEQDRHQALAAGFDDVLTKPFGRRALLELISRHFPDAIEPTVGKVSA